VKRAASDKNTAAADAAHYHLRLFVTGTTPRSARAIQNIRAICEEHLQGRYDLEVIDIYQHPEHAKVEQIVVTPTLVKRTPVPIRKLIGDLSDTGRVLIGLDIAPRPLPAPPRRTNMPLDTGRSGGTSLGTAGTGSMTNTALQSATTHSKMVENPGLAARNGYRDNTGTAILRPAGDARKGYMGSAATAAFEPRPTWPKSARGKPSQAIARTSRFSRRGTRPTVCFISRKARSSSASSPIPGKRR